MTQKQIADFFEKRGDDCSGGFDGIPPGDRLSKRKDLHAFLLLSMLDPNSDDDIVACAEHDQIWLGVPLKRLKKATEDQLLQLIRCGVFYSSDSESLCMFA